MLIYCFINLIHGSIIMQKTKWLTLIASLTTSLLIATHAYSAIKPADFIDEISLAVKNSSADFSGALIVYQGGATPFERYYALGLADVKSQTPFTEDTVVDIASITKQFTGAAIVRLESQKKLTTRDKLGQYIPGLKPHLSVISLHQLLTHTSGLTGATGDDFEAISLTGLIKKLNRTPLSYQKGKHHYSNLGYSLLAAVIEKVSGKTYDQYLNDEFFQPLGMTRTGYVIPKFNDKDVAHGYDSYGDWGQPHHKNWASDGPYWNFRGNGGILSTVSDMYLWMKALQTDAVFSAVEKEKYFGLHVKEYPDTESYYGYGWVTEKLQDGKKLIWHNGSNGVFTADVRYYPEDNLFYIIVGNRSDAQVWKLSEQIHEFILD